MSRWQFGPAELDEGSFELRLDGRLLAVERKPLEVLLCLLRHGNELVSKEQILDAVWPGRIITESVLTKCIAKLRDALDDHRQSLIKTAHGHGYRIVVPVRAHRSSAHEFEIVPAGPSGDARDPAGAAEPVLPAPAAVAPPATTAAATPVAAASAAGAHAAVITPAAAPGLSLFAQPVAADAPASLAWPVDVQALASSTLSTPKPLRSRRTLRWMQAGFTAALIALLAGVYAAVVVHNRAVAPMGAVAKSVAVLPFANLSDESGNDHFTDGLHDSVLAHLALIQDLSVISRTSVMQYREGTRNLRQIARALGVDNIVEGSVQRSGSRLRVTAQLIDTSTDTHLWAGQFDRSLSDVFIVQAEIAQQIATAVHARLTPEERGRIEAKPTQSTAAYDLYLRALEVSRRANWEQADIEAAITQLEQAIALDPRFALAFALKSGLHDSIYWSGRDPSEARRDRSRTAAEMALHLDPGLPEAHIAMGRFLYHGARNYTAAIESLERARALAPGNTQVPFWLGAIYRRQARWDEALATLEHAAQLDPRNEVVQAEYAWTLAGLKRWAQADAVYARLETFAAKPALIRVKRGYLSAGWTGSTAQLEQAMRELPADDTSCDAAFARWQLQIFQRRFRDAAAEILSCKDEDAKAGESGNVPREFFIAAAYEMGGEHATARPFFEKARPRLEQLVAGARLPEQPAGRVALAFTLLALGERTAAIGQVDQALADAPLEWDALAGVHVISFAAAFHAVAGDSGRALALLKRSLELPFGETANGVMLNPNFDSLRDDPRFRTLIAQHTPAPPPQPQPR